MGKNYIKCAGRRLKRMFTKGFRLNKRIIVKFKLLLTLTLIILVVLLYRVSPMEEPAENKGQSIPTIMWWSEIIKYEDGEKRHCPNNIQCALYSNDDQLTHPKIDAYLFYASTLNFSVLPLPRRPDTVLWGLCHEESPRNVPELMYEKILNLFNYSSTFSRYSNIPFPLQHFEHIEKINSKEHFVPTSVKNSLLNEIAPVLYLQSNCDTSTERDDYVRELMKYIKVDSYGACLNNKKLPDKISGIYYNELYNDDNLMFLAKYKFVIAIENGVCDDYVTEKFWRPIIVGTVPIYFGSPSIRDWLPNEKSAILIEDFSSPKLLSEHLKKLSEDDKVYEEYLEHKIHGTIFNKKLINYMHKRPYQTDFSEVIKEFECFICKKLHDRRMYGGEVSMVNKSHYNCPVPISVLTRKVNPKNRWVQFLEWTQQDVEKLYKSISESNLIEMKGDGFRNL